MHNPKKARHVQEEWNEVYREVEKMFVKTIDNKHVLYKRYELAKELKFRSQKLTFLMILFIAYMEGYVYIDDKEIENIQNDLKNSMLGITQYYVINNTFFDHIYNILPDIKQASINNWFRRAGFRPVNGDWITFWNREDEEISKTMIYYGIRN